MIVSEYLRDGSNTGRLKKSQRLIQIKRGSWCRFDKDTQNCKDVHKLTIEKNSYFRDKYVYLLKRYGSKDGINYISLNFFENQRFLLIQQNHWLQQEKNIRYLISLVFLTIGVVLAYLNLK